jgi:hypothetical protein
LNKQFSLRLIFNTDLRKEREKDVFKLKGIVQPFELGGVTRLIRSAVKFCMAGNKKKKFLMVQSHERILKLICAA